MGLIIICVVVFVIIGAIYISIASKGKEKNFIEEESNEIIVDNQIRENNSKNNLKNIEQKQDIQNNEILKYIEKNKFDINGGELKKFKIANIEIEFYSNIRIYKQLKDYFDKTNNNINEIIKIYKNSINTLPEGVQKVEEYNEYFNNYYNKIAEMIVKILVKNDIYEITVQDIVSNLEAMEEFNKIIKNGREIQINSQKEIDLLSQNILNEAQAIINMPNPNVSMGIISSSPLQILVFGLNDAINSTYKKFTSTDVKILKSLAQQTNTLVEQSKSIANSNNEIILNSINAVTYKFMNELFEYMIKVLIDNKKLCSKVVEKLNVEKSNKIIENLKNIENEEKKEEQLIKLLQLNPYSKAIHKEIMKYKDLDINNYVEMLNFIDYKEIEDLLANRN